MLLEITDNKFKATSIIESNKFSLFSIIKIYFYLYFRDVFLELKRNLGFYKFGYRELTNRFNVNESSPSLSGVLLPFKFNNFNIETLNSNFTKNIFIALQVNPESTIDYYSSNIEFINIENTLLELINTLTPFGYKFYIKDHPNMFGKRDFHFLKNFLTNYDNVYYVPYSYSSNELISKCNFVFTWSGTVCIQAFLSNRVPITICSPYKIDDNNFIILKEFADFKNLNNLLIKSHSCKISEDSKRELISLIISTLLPGKLYLHNNKKITDNDIENLINILDVNKILQL